MPKGVIDANVIVSSLFGGTPRKAFLRALRTCDIFISPDIRAELTCLLDELEKKLGSAKTKRLRSIVLKLISSAQEVNPARKITLSRDRKDNSYLSLCLTVRADFLLTGDKDLLEIPPRQLKSAGLNRLRIVSPNAFLAS
jgi:putative PIN family toxin of toxin-antitoxin system